MAAAEQADTRKRLIFNCGCLASIISICVICSGLGGAILWPGAVGLEDTFARWNLTAYNYENLRQRFSGQPAAAPTSTTDPTPEPTSPPLPTATFTPFPTFTPTPTPTASPTVPPTDTPAARP